MTLLSGEVISMVNFIFDIDGTLIDTFDVYVPTLKQVLQGHGYSPSDSELASGFGISGDDALKNLGIRDIRVRQTIFNEWAQASVQRIEHATLYPGIEATLRQLKLNQQVKLVIATSKTKQDYENGFQDRYAIGRLFDAYVTVDDTTEHKPNPAPIVAGLDKVNAQLNNSIYIGDTVHDLQAAHAAGIKFAAALWGAMQPEQLVLADYHLNEPADLLKLV